MKTEILTQLEAHIVAECEPIDRESRFDDMLNDCYSFEKVGGPFECMSPSRVLKEVDPVAYRCGVNDYSDSCGWVEVDGNEYEQDDAEKAKEQFVKDLESRISDLENEIEELEADEDHNLGTVAHLKQQLYDLQSDLKAVESHSF